MVLFPLFSLVRNVRKVHVEMIDEHEHGDEVLVNLTTLHYIY